MLHYIHACRDGSVHSEPQTWLLLRMRRGCGQNLRAWWSLVYISRLDWWLSVLAWIVLVKKPFHGNATWNRKRKVRPVLHEVQLSGIRSANYGIINVALWYMHVGMGPVKQTKAREYEFHRFHVARTPHQDQCSSALKYLGRQHAHALSASHQLNAQWVEGVKLNANILYEALDETSSIMFTCENPSGQFEV